MRGKMRGLSADSASTLAPGSVQKEEERHLLLAPPMRRLLLVLGILSFLFSVFITPLQDPRGFPEWFRYQQQTITDVPSAAHPIFDLTLFSYAMAGTHLAYEVYGNLFVNTTARFAAPWQYELMNFLMIYFAPQGKLTVRSFCQTLAPQPGDFDGAQDLQPANGWPTTREGWLDLMQDTWGIGRNWRPPVPGDPGSWPQEEMIATWTSEKSNFLWQIYSIPVSSMLVKAFVMNKRVDEVGHTLYPTLMDPLLGLTCIPPISGWWGFCQQVQALATDLQHAPWICNYIWMQTAPDPPEPSTGDGKACVGAVVGALANTAGTGLTVCAPALTFLPVVGWGVCLASMAVSGGVGAWGVVSSGAC